MATFRSSALVALCCLGCVHVAPITRDQIEHVAPKPEFVGPAPARFEWTAAAGVEEYSLTIENEVDMLIFEARTRDTWLEWPKGNTLDPGTYFWRVAGVNEGRRMADSGRAAFVVTRAAD